MINKISKGQGLSLDVVLYAIVMLVLFAIIILVVVPGARADLIIIPESTHVQTENQNINYTARINNTYNFNLINLTCADTSSVKFYNQLLIINNSVSEMVYTVNTEGYTNYSETTTCQFKYYTEQEVDNVNHTVELKNSGNFPPTLNITKGDHITFKNLNETSNITIKEINNLWSFNIPNNGEVTREFTSTGRIDYLVMQTGYVGNITVNSNTQPLITHNTAYDTKLEFNLRSHQKDTQVKVHFLTTHYNMNYSETRNGAIFIEVIAGQTPLYNVKLVSEPNWIDFDEQGFTVIDNAVVTYKIKPIINSTNETGHNHTVKIVVASNNAPGVEAEITVYIKNETSIDEALAGLPPNFFFITESQLKAFCEKYPTQCPHQIVTKIEYRNITSNDTAEIRELKSYVERVYNKYSLLESGVKDSNTKADNIVKTLTVLSKRIDTNKDLLKQYNKSREGTVTSVVVLLALILTGVVAFFGYKFLNNYVLNRRLD